VVSSVIAQSLSRCNSFQRVLQFINRLEMVSTVRSPRVTLENEAYFLSCHFDRREKFFFKLFKDFSVASLLRNDFPFISI